MQLTICLAPDKTYHGLCQSYVPFTRLTSRLLQIALFVYLEPHAALSRCWSKYAVVRVANPGRKVCSRNHHRSSPL